MRAHTHTHTHTQSPPFPSCFFSPPPPPPLLPGSLGPGSGTSGASATPGAAGGGGAGGAGAGAGAPAATPALPPLTAAEARTLPHRRRYPRLPSSILKTSVLQYVPTLACCGMREWAGPATLSLRPDCSVSRGCMFAPHATWKGWGLGNVVAGAPRSCYCVHASCPCATPPPPPRPVCVRVCPGLVQPDTPAATGHAQGGVRGRPGHAACHRAGVRRPKVFQAKKDVWVVFLVRGHPPNPCA